MGASAIALAIPPATLLFITSRQILFHRPWSTPSMTNGNLVFLTALLLLVYLRLVTVRLVTQLRPDQISVAMRGFWRRIRVPIGDIVTAAPVEYDPVSEYRGYGVRPGPRGQAYIAAGNQGVQLELSDGRRLLIGSQRSRELARLITAARRQRA